MQSFTGLHRRNGRAITRIRTGVAAASLLTIPIGWRKRVDSFGVASYTPLQRRTYASKCTWRARCACFRGIDSPPSYRKKFACSLEIRFGISMDHYYESYAKCYLTLPSVHNCHAQTTDSRLESTRNNVQRVSLVAITKHRKKLPRILGACFLDSSVFN